MQKARHVGRAFCMGELRAGGAVRGVYPLGRV